MTVTTTIAHAHEELREDHRRIHALVDRLRAAEDLGALLRSGQTGRLADIHPLQDAVA